MKAIEIMKSKKNLAVLACDVVAAVIVVFLAGMLTFCSSQADAGDVGSGKAVGSVLGRASGEIGPINLAGEEGPADAESAETEGQAEGADESAPVETAQAAAQDRASEASGSGGNSQSSSSASASTPDAPKPSTAPAPQKRWVEDTQQVWVEDRAAWTESIPAYGTKEVSICNICGSDITGNTTAHGKAHMMAGEGSGHHSEVQRVVTGYESVSHPAEGHYETKVVGGHWE